MIKHISGEMSGRLDSDTINRIALRMEEEWVEGDTYGTVVEDLCKELSIPLASVNNGKAVMKVEGDRDMQTVLMTQSGACVINSNPKPKPVCSAEKLKAIFWNSNGWDITKAQKLSSLVAEEKIHVVCITDTRQDVIDAPRKLSTIIFYLNIKTGMKWSG